LRRLITSKHPEDRSNPDDQAAPSEGAQYDTWWWWSHHVGEGNGASPTYDTRGQSQAGLHLFTDACLSG
jgi:hypothetical protein